jgi:hypothetical protein
VQRQKRLKLVWSSSIDTPGILIDKTKRPSVFLGFHPDVAPILEGFTSISYPFRRSWRACNVKNSHGARAAPL